MRVSVSSLLMAAMVVVCAAASVPGQTHKPSFSVTLGDEVISLPAPEGHEEATSQWEVVKTRWAATVPKDGDLLAGFLPLSDGELLRKGQQPLYPTWTIISVWREARTHAISTAEFARVVAYARQNNEKAMNPENSLTKETQAVVDQVLSKEYSKDVKIDLNQPKILREFDKRPNAYNILMLMNLKVQVDGKEVTQQPVLATMTLLLVKQRVVTICNYKKLKSNTDGDTLTQFTSKWISEILAAN